MSELPGYDAFETFRGPDFTLDRPAGWAVAEDDHGLILVEGDGTRLAIWPVTANQPVAGRAAELLPTLAGQLSEGMSWSEGEPLSDLVWATQGQGERAGFARLVLGAPADGGQPLWLYLATAPDADRLAAVKPLAERVFRSYRPVAAEEATPGEAGADEDADRAAPPGAGAMTRQVEPTEGAFAVAVPAGWRFQAGVLRYGVFGSPWFRLMAEDGAEIRDLDPRVPTSYLEPSPATQFMGRPVGSVADGVMIRPYTPPTTFAVEYATWWAQESGAEGIELSRQLDDREALAALTPGFRQTVEQNFQRSIARQARLMPQMRSQFELAAIAFSCTGGQGELAGLLYIFGTRAMMPGPPGAAPIQSWTASPFGFLGPAERRDELERVLNAVGASKQANPDWEQRQDQAFAQKMQSDRLENQRRNAEINRLWQNMPRPTIQPPSTSVGDTLSEISDITHQGYMGRQHSSNEGQRRTVNAIHGQADIYNPATGQVTWGVPGHADHYFVDSFGNTVGTQIDENPDPFRFTRGQNLDDLYDTGGS